MRCLIGYGNTLRQDDGVGCWLVQQLAPHYADSDVNIITAHQLLPEIAYTVMQAQHVVFVDASIEGRAGDVNLEGIQPLSHLEDAHALTPAGVLYVCGMMGGQIPPAHLITITGANFNLGEDFSVAVQDALPHALDTVRRLLEK
jgi:hydrogenase maturation protease